MKNSTLRMEDFTYHKVLRSRKGQVSQLHDEEHGGLAKTEIFPKALIGF
jgi:hypothetical protein